MMTFPDWTNLLKGHFLPPEPPPPPVPTVIYEPINDAETMTFRIKVSKFEGSFVPTLEKAEKFAKSKGYIDCELMSVRLTHLGAKVSDPAVYYFHASR